MRWRYKAISELMINEQIRDREIRLIGSNGEQLGIMSAKDAMKLLILCARSIRTVLRMPAEPIRPVIRLLSTQVRVAIQRSQSA